MSGELCTEAFHTCMCSSCSAFSSLLKDMDLNLLFFSVSLPNTQRGPGSHADEPVLGREPKSGNNHTHTPTAISVLLIDRESLSWTRLPLSMLWPQCCQRPLRICGEGEHKHARLTLWELTGPPVSEGQAESVV